MTSQGTVISPLLLSFYINNISTSVESEGRLSTNAFVCYHEIKAEEDTYELQKDINHWLFDKDFDLSIRQVNVM